MFFFVVFYPMWTQSNPCWYVIGYRIAQSEISTEKTPDQTYSVHLVLVVHFYFYFNSMSLQDVKDHGYSVTLSVNYYDLREKIVQSMSRYTVTDGFLFISVGHLLLQFLSSEFSPIHSIHKCSLRLRTLINTVYVNLTYNCTHTKSLSPT